MKNKTGKKVLYYAILAILLGVFCFSGYQIYSYYSEHLNKMGSNPKRL